MSASAVHQIGSQHSQHHSRASVQAKRNKHRSERKSWARRARELILEIADGEFSRSYRQYDGYVD